MKKCKTCNGTKVHGHHESCPYSDPNILCAWIGCLCGGKPCVDCKGTGVRGRHPDQDSNLGRQD